jgi:dephospho-CoA kinase
VRKEFKIIVVGIVGKIASGKSMVCSYIEKIRKKVLTLDLDKIAKEIYCEDKKVVQELKYLFGKEIIGPKNKIKFKVLARKVFSNQGELEKLNKIMFPLIREKVRKIIDDSSDKNYVVIDAAILFDCNLHLLCDYVIHVKTERNKRKKFLKNKNKDMTEEDINIRLDGQHLKINNSLAGYVIENNGSKTNLYKKVKSVLDKIENSGDAIQDKQ